MVSEVLSKMIKKAEMSFILGFKVEEERVMVSHLQFADDTMIFCDADICQIGYLRCILRCFEMVSGLQINFAKSEMLQIGEVREIEDLAWVLGCKIGSLLSYLGIPLGANFKSKVVWNKTIDIIAGRLASWKVPMLLKGGRMTLIKSTLMSTHNYLFSLFTIPVSVANKIESMFKFFLWNDGPECHHYYLVDWKTIFKPMDNGGLGFRELVYHNRALLAKWLW